ncbi:MAG: 4-hydroxy-tetrahydrodipicolinate synthase [Clostridia bacterium]|nr:4-hydroxy-tetrahydrodipicolinate synthase [Clostridia bacterium]
MKKKTVFRGIATALITPFKDGQVDFDAYGRFIDWQIEQGINALVACGTTGESSTLSDEEHRAALAFAVKRAAGRVPVIAGTGSNELDYAVDLSKYAVSVGADAILVVTPYYNKATQKGLIGMYTAIADAAGVPTILYNVPSRTGVNIEPKTYAALAEHPDIVAFKEANGNISKIVETMSYVRGKLDLYSGNDDQIVPLMAMGGIGAISVLSNILPRETVSICDRFFAGDVAGAAELQCHYHALIDALFAEVNPIPVKAAVAAMGFSENSLRLPLTELEEGHKQTLLALMRKEGLDV